MARRDRLRQRILSGRSDRGIRFEEMLSLLQRLGFACRIRGSHHILSREGVAEILNLQPRPDGSAKPYQVRQVRDVLVKYKLGGDDDE